MDNLVLANWHKAESDILCYRLGTFCHAKAGHCFHYVVCSILHTPPLNRAQVNNKCRYNISMAFLIIPRLNTSNL